MKLDYNPDVLTCLANLSNDEVFTPPHIALKMLDILPPELWSNPKAKFLDPFCKSGVFLREIAAKLIEGLQDQIPNLQERIDHIMHNQIYGIAITELTSSITRRSLYCAKEANSRYSVAQGFQNEVGNIQYSNIAHTWVKDRCKYCGASKAILGEASRSGLENYAYQFIHNQNPYETMEFDVIIGNPPYQLNVGVEKKNFAVSIYQKFVEQAIQLNPRYLVLIIPSRWYAGGRGLTEFREKMLKDRRISEIHDFSDASKIFPGIELKGGVNYFLWDRQYNGDCVVYNYENLSLVSQGKRPLKEKGADSFIRNNEAISIFKKVSSLKEKKFSDLVSMQTPFGLHSSFSKYKSVPFEGSVQVYGNKYTGYIQREQVLTNSHWIDEHKVYLPSAIGSGDVSKDLYKPIYGAPGTCCTQTYVLIGPFHSEEKARNVMAYILTKFFRYMTSLKKNAQHSNRGVYDYVPQQDFQEPVTDKTLYKKYKLSTEEIDIIERTVRNIPTSLFDAEETE